MTIDFTRDELALVNTMLQGCRNEGLVPSLKAISTKIEAAINSDCLNREASKEAMLKDMVAETREEWRVMDARDTLARQEVAEDYADRMAYLMSVRDGGTPILDCSAWAVASQMIYCGVLTLIGHRTLAAYERNHGLAKVVAA